MSTKWLSGSATDPLWLRTNPQQQDGLRIKKFVVLFIKTSIQTRVRLKESCFCWSACLQHFGSTFGKNMICCAETCFRLLLYPLGIPTTAVCRSHSANLFLVRKTLAFEFTVGKPKRASSDVNRAKSQLFPIFLLSDCIVSKNDKAPIIDRMQHCNTINTQI